MIKHAITVAFLATAFVAGSMAFGADTAPKSKGQSVVHQGGGEATAAFPDVCKTPSPPSPIPIPYPNISKSSDTAKGTKKVKADGNPVMEKDSSFSMSAGDEPGTSGRDSFGKTRPQGYFIRLRQQMEHSTSIEHHQAIPSPSGYTDYGPGGPGVPVQSMGPVKPEQPMRNRAQERDWTEIELKSKDVKPIPRKRYQITVPHGSTREGRLESRGKAQGFGGESERALIPSPQDKEGAH